MPEVEAPGHPRHPPLLSDAVVNGNPPCSLATPSVCPGNFPPQTKLVMGLNKNENS